MKGLIERIFITPAHQYKGYYGRPPGDSPMLEQSEIRCLAGRGIEGDRFLNYKEDFKGQITFFSGEVFEAVLDELGLDRQCHCPSLVRRNVITRGVDLNQLIGQRFQLQGIEFEGSEECAPCEWMNHALTDGAYEILKGRGGLRARIRTDGTLRTGPL